VQVPQIHPTDALSYARCIEHSRRVRWEIDRDVLRGREVDASRKFLPDSLAQMAGFDFLSAAERRFVSQIQGRTYANMFTVIERAVSAKVLEISRAHWLGDQTALEALVRFTEDELKHQALFRRLEGMMAARMPAGYRFAPDLNAVAGAVLSNSTWAVLALSCLFELVSQVHYRQSIDPEPALDPVWKDVFLYHWKEEAQHAVLDELEWRREDAKLDGPARDRAVGELIGLIRALDGTLQVQVAADAGYFAQACGRAVGREETERVRAGLLHAYRWQYILSGVQVPHFTAILSGMLNAAQYSRMAAALAPYFDGTAVPEVRAAA
jgi:hypothetical protein